MSSFFRLFKKKESTEEVLTKQPSATLKKIPSGTPSELNEQLAQKVKHPSGVPGSFYERDLNFKAEACPARRTAVPPRHQGQCQIKQGRFSSWVNMWMKIHGGKMKLYLMPQGLCADVHDTEELEEVRTIALVGSHLMSCNKSKFVFIIEESGGHSIFFKCDSNRTKDEWFVGLGQVPGLFREVQDFYSVEKLWGSGATCNVHECISKFTGSRFALKSRIHKDRESTEAMHNELRILQMCSKNPHPSIPILVDFFFDTNGEIQLVTELMEGGEVYHDVCGGKFMSEEKARVIFRQVASGIAHLHSLGIAHRDIKPENLMYKNDINGAGENDIVVKIMDYDLAKVNFCPEWVASSPCGTISYMAPEMLQHCKYSLSVDSWSLGVCLYIFLCGKMPIQVEEVGDSFAQELTNALEFTGTPWSNVSNEAKSLIKRLLEMDPGKRISVNECLNHEWIVRDSPSIDRKGSGSIKINRPSVACQLPFIEESPQISPLTSSLLGVSSSPPTESSELSTLRVLMDTVGKPAGVVDSREARKQGGPASPVAPLAHGTALPHSDSFADLEGSYLGDEDLDEDLGDD